MQTTVKTIRDARDRTTPPGVRRRRIAFGALVTLTAAALMALMLATLAPGGFNLVDSLVITLFAVTVPYGAVGFWNAVIGFSLMRFARDPVALTTPAAAGAPADRPVVARTAILSCVRNEDMDAVSDRLAAMLDGLDHEGLAHAFDLYVLSDTNQPEVAREEEAAFARLEARFADRFRLVYRRRTDNRGFKAGNIRDFAERWGADYDFALTLDADSCMSAGAMARLVRIMQASPEIGILQSLVVGLPSESAFARMFQFGMRLGMRSHTLGAAWWQADCGPYWGHNALIRLAPFTAHCDMPTIPGDGPLSGDILSHDQVEAVLMRRAGYEVRVVPVEDESYEENPPNLVEFVRRDLRWCAGNMQYVHLFAMPGLRLVSRVQLVLATLMFAGAAAWMGMVTLFALAAVFPETLGLRFDPTAGGILFASVMALVFAPKLATVIDVTVRRGKAGTFGGLGRFVVGILGEVVFFALLAPIAALSSAMFIAGLPFGRRMVWSSQQRRGGGLPFGLAVRRFWPHTLTGLLLLAALWQLPLAVLLAAAPLLIGLIAVVPFSMLTASPAFGRWLVRRRLFAIPEDIDPPASVRAIDLPALRIAGHAPLPSRGARADLSGAAPDAAQV